MHTDSLRKVNNITVFKDFHTPNNVVCKELPDHIHGAESSKDSFSSNDIKGHGHIKDDKNVLKKALPMAGAVIGTILPLVLINKFEGKSLKLKNLNLKNFGKYFEIDDVKRILSSAAGAIAGGLAGGFMADKNKENRKEKLKEGIFEMTNISIPTILAAGILKLMNKNGLNKGLAKFAPFILGVGAGVPIASKISSTISKNIFKEDESKQRKFQPKDFLVHSDDMVEALVLLKFPLVKKLHIDKILALIYMKCGYEAGSKDEHSKGHHH